MLPFNFFVLDTLLSHFNIKMFLTRLKIIAVLTTELTVTTKGWRTPVHFKTGTNF